MEGEGKWRSGASLNSLHSLPIFFACNEMPLGPSSVSGDVRGAVVAVMRKKLW